MIPKSFSIIIETDSSHRETVYQIIIQIHFNIKTRESPEIPVVGRKFYQNDTTYLVLRYLQQGFPLKHKTNDVVLQSQMSMGLPGFLPWERKKNRVVGQDQALILFLSWRHASKGGLPRMSVSFTKLGNKSYCLLDFQEGSHWKTRTGLV